jgi:hypothetical protein
MDLAAPGKVAVKPLSVTRACVAERLIQIEGRRNAVCYRNQRIGKRAYGHTDLRKLPATLPFPYPLAKSGAQSRSIAGAYRRSRGRLGVSFLPRLSPAWVALVGWSNEGNANTFWL